MIILMASSFCPSLLLSNNILRSSCLEKTRQGRERSLARITPILPCEIQFWLAYEARRVVLSSENHTTWNWWKHSQQQIFICSILSCLLSFQNSSSSSFWLLTVHKNGGEKHLSCNDILSRQCYGFQTEIMCFMCTNRRGSLSQIVEATYHSDTRKCTSFKV